MNTTLDDDELVERLRRTYDAIARTTVVDGAVDLGALEQRPMPRRARHLLAAGAALVACAVVAVVVWANVRGPDHIVVGDGDGVTTSSSTSAPATTTPPVVEQHYEEVPVPDELRAPLGGGGTFNDVRPAAGLRAFRVNGSPVFGLGDLAETDATRKFAVPTHHCVIYRYATGEQGTASCNGGQDMVAVLSEFPTTTDVVVWGTVPAAAAYAELEAPGLHLRATPVAGTVAFRVDGRAVTTSPPDLSNRAFVYLRAYGPHGKLLDKAVTTVRPAAGTQRAPGDPSAAATLRR